MFVFVPVTGLRTQLTRVRTDARFAAEDPWNQNRPGSFSLDSYMVTLRGVKSVPEGAQEGRWLDVFHRALRSEADGVTRFLPESLIELWLTKQVAMEALPGLLKQIEPSLKKSDYKPILRSWRMKIFGIFETICCAGLVIIATIAVVFGHAPWWLGALVVTGTASVCWLFLYLAYFGKVLRRRRQMQWLLERKRAGRSAAVPPLPPLISNQPPPPPPPPLISPQPMPLQTVVHPTLLEGKDIQLGRAAKDVLPAGLDAKDFRFESVMAVPEVMEPAMPPRLRKAFPELTWQDEAENWDKVRIEGTSREMPRRVVVSIVRKESPGAFQLTILVSARGQAEAVKAVSEMIERIKSALLGWSQFHLPTFKPRPAAGVDINQREVVELLFPLERGLVRLIGGNADILVSRILLEALSRHGEIVNSRGSKDDESRAAGIRGARARLILGSAAPSGAGQDLEVKLDVVREGEYLAGEILELGWAQVVPHGAGAASHSPRRISVHYFGSRMAPTAGFGFISYSGADVEAGYPGEFLHLDWWRS